MAFYLEVKNFKPEQIKSVNFSFNLREILTDEEADDFINLQEKAEKEISQDINVLTKEALTKILPGRIGTLIFLLVYNENNLIAYGYSHQDLFIKSICYINTIYVVKEFRGKGLSKTILNMLIEKSIAENKNFITIKGVTQLENTNAIQLLIKCGFKYKKEDL